MSSDDAFWSEARNRICADPTKINLNAGTLSPTPIPVLAAVNALRMQQASAPSDFCWRASPPLLMRSRNRLAGYLNCSPGDLLLLPNVTFAINLVVASLRLPPASEIVMTDHEYGAMLNCWQRLAKRDGLHIKQLQLPYRSEDPDETVESFSSAISDRTRIVYFSHCNTSTGLVMPARAIARLARDRNILVVIDGAHAPGMVPVNLSEIGADFYGANCHKWMMAPAGAGFLHVAPQRKAMLESIITSWGYGYDVAAAGTDSGLGGTFWQRDHEFHGTVDRCPQMVLPEALDFRQSLGGDEAIVHQYRQRVDYARQRLGAIGLKSITPANREMSGCIVAFNYPCADPLKFRDAIWNKFRIECPVTKAADSTFLRVSCAWFNTRDEIDRLAHAIEAGVL